MSSRRLALLLRAAPLLYAGIAITILMLLRIHLQLAKSSSTAAAATAAATYTEQLQAEAAEHFGRGLALNIEPGALGDRLPSTPFLSGAFAARARAAVTHMRRMGTHQRHGPMQATRCAPWPRGCWTRPTRS
jgi:hypothetical protein